MMIKLVKTVPNTPRNLVMVNYAWVNCAIKDKDSWKTVPVSNAIHICAVKINTLVDLTFVKMVNKSEKMVHVVHVTISTECQLTESNASKTNATKDNSLKRTVPANTVKHSLEQQRTIRIVNLISVKRISSSCLMVHARSAHNIRKCTKRDHVELPSA